MKTITCSFVVVVAVAADEEPKQQYLVVARRSLPEVMSSWKSQEGETKGRRKRIERSLMENVRSIPVPWGGSLEIITSGSISVQDARPLEEHPVPCTCTTLVEKRSASSMYLHDTCRIKEPPVPFTCRTLVA
jgi:hypothetical protein